MNIIIYILAAIGALCVCCATGLFLCMFLISRNPHPHNEEYCWIDDELNNQ